MIPTAKRLALALAMVLCAFGTAACDLGPKHATRDYPQEQT